jgi:hypothetical protein
MFIKKAIASLLLTLLLHFNTQAGDQVITVKAKRYTSPQLVVRVAPVSPDQIASFYIGRGFPASMIKRLRETCYYTIGVHNKSKTVIWHDLSKWRFYTKQAPLIRYDRTYWKKYWQKTKAPLPSQATFRWTLMPESLDFQPYEREGGNIILHRQPRPFTIEAVFRFGRDKQGKKLTLRFINLRCAEDK